MDEELRARIAEALAAAGLTGFRDTTSSMRPQWRASFSFSGALHGESSYVHLYVPADADLLQVNSAVPSAALDPAPKRWLEDALAEVNAVYVAGSSELSRVLGRIGAAPSDIAGWELAARPYVGMQHRMVMARVTLPLALLSPRSLDLAVRLGLYLAGIAREFLTSQWEASESSE